MKRMLGLATIAYGMLTLSGLLVTSWLQHNGRAIAFTLVAMAMAYVSSVCAHTSIDDDNRQVASLGWLIVAANLAMALSLASVVIAFLSLAEF